MGFSYLKPGDLYFDSACQTLRPQEVIDAMEEYYRSYNACGGRVKYAWGIKVDEAVNEARRKLLSYAGKSERDYACAFTLNTTYGINLILSQLSADRFSRVVTSDIEHNSVFLPTITYSKANSLERRVLERGLDGSLKYRSEDVSKAIVVVNATSNINGVSLINAKQLARDIHAAGGIFIIDGAQTMGHQPALVRDVEFDALCFSGHKMYGPSIGVVIFKKKLLDDLSLDFIGGGMVEDVQRDSFTLLRDDLPSRFEPGLQNFAGIIGLAAALDWLATYRPSGSKPEKHEQLLATKLFDGLGGIKSVKLLNDSPSSIISFFSEKVDAHRLAIALSTKNIMARSGYFCCHYYLHAKKQLPPMLRLSLGLNNDEQQVEALMEVLRKAIGGS